jgi:catechol 2,3-dioxygenase-like lactoylglutathione lyase family enzyme
MSPNAAAPRSLNHVAYPTWDSGATYRFYTEVLGCDFLAAISEDRVPSTGEPHAFLHTFYGFTSGECIAFFEVDDLAPPTPDGIPSWIRHLALNVDTVEALDAWKERLTAHGVEVLGTVDHEETWISLYFFDPNGVRIELTAQVRELTEEDGRAGLDLLTRWTSARGQSITLGA